MGEAKRRKERADEAIERAGVWRVTRGAEEIGRSMAAEEARITGIVKGLAKCTVCGGAARAVIYGLEGTGVWIGCDRSGECSRYIEMRDEGWSLEEVAAEWNRYNSGMYGVLRKIKRVVFGRFSEIRRKEKAMRAAKEKAESSGLKERAAVFGIEREGEKGRRWRRFWRKGNK